MWAQSLVGEAPETHFMVYIIQYTRRPSQNRDLPPGDGLPAVIGSASNADSKIFPENQIRARSLAQTLPVSSPISAQLAPLDPVGSAYRREQIEAGMQALAGQVMLWAEPRERSTQRTRHALADLDAYARMFRNDLHNISLVGEIEQRAWERREQH